METLGEGSSDAPQRPARVALGIGAGLATLMLLLHLSLPPSLTRFFFASQDLAAAIVQIALLAAFGLGILPMIAVRRVPTLSWPRMLATAAVLALALWAGAYLVFANYPLSRDEQMVVFDAAIYAHGDLAAPLAPGWQPFALAMAPHFLLELPGFAAWVSSYMPVNAAIHAFVATVADPALANPLLAAVGLVALWRVARRLFPDDRSTQAVVLILYMTSAQMIAAAMTTYAMTGHLALNLVWLALFLRGDRIGHGGAVVVGALAIGLHQVIFHPLFVLPFLDHLRRRGEWRTALFYAAVYAGAGLFWISYPQIVATLAGAETSSGGGTGGAIDFLATRVAPLLLERDVAGTAYMGANLFRFATWENAALLPLAVMAVPMARRSAGIAQPLYWGILLTVLTMYVLLPYQGHGWGYRYLHGVIGSFALLAGYGWRGLADRAPGRALIVAGTAGALLTTPLLLWRAREFALPYAKADAAIARADADFVVIDTEGGDFLIDLVRNDPYLSNRPVRFSAWHLDRRRVALLCARGRIAFFAHEDMARFGLHVGDRPRERWEALRDATFGRPCVANRVESGATPLAGPRRSWHRDPNHRSAGHMAPSRHRVCRYGGDRLRDRTAVRPGRGDRLRAVEEAGGVHDRRLLCGLWQFCFGRVGKRLFTKAHRLSAAACLTKFWQIALSAEP